jgi:hypothetical protein
MYLPSPQRYKLGELQLRAGGGEGKRKKKIEA